MVSCSALKRSYRDLLRGGGAGEAVFLHLHGDRDVLAARVAGRPGHFMPAALIDSQFETLEPLQPDERGAALDVSSPVDDLVEQSLQLLAPQDGTHR